MESYGVPAPPAQRVARQRLLRALRENDADEKTIKLVEPATQRWHTATPRNDGQAGTTEATR